jgi:ATP-dependent DNA ligase
MKYDSYRYIYPPRPENKIPVSSLSEYDDGGTYMAEPKFNGDNGVIFFNPKKIISMNRHNRELSHFKLDPTEFKNLSPKGWNCLNGEYMAESKKDENNLSFNHKFVIFDELIHNNNYLIGTTFEERWNTLYDRYGNRIIGENEYSYQISENIWLVKRWLEDFVNIWHEIVKIDMIEGFVLKRRDWKLQSGNSERNNHLGQFKCRKSTLNYSY